MCLRPIQIKVKKSNNYFREQADNILGLFALSRNEYIQVPCGKCLECIKERQNHHAYRLYNRIKEFPCVYHITLTYKPEALPFSSCVQHIDHVTGEVIRVSKPEIVSDPFILRFLRNSYKNLDKGTKPLFSYCSHDDDKGGYSYENIFTPSLNRYDVRSALKVCRILYKRKTGSVPRFVYSFCGEMGPTRCRPHYHFIISDKSDISDFVQFFSSYWEKKFGYTVVKKVERVTQFEENGKIRSVDGYLCAARYISKYISKGEFECSSVVDGFAQSPRLCQSLNIDSARQEVIDRDLKPYHLAYDVFGSYNQFNFTFDATGKKMTPYHIHVIVDEIIKRSRVFLGQAVMSMPRYLREKIFCLQVLDLYNNIRYVRSPLSYLVSYRVQELFSEVETRKFSKIQDDSAFFGLVRRLSVSSENREQRIRQNYQAFLSRQISNQ